MRPRLSGLLALAVFAVSAAPADAALTRDAFEAKANTRCAKTTKKATARVKKINDGKLTLDPASSPIKSGKAVLAIIPLGLKLYDSIDALALPPADASAIRGWTRAQRFAYRRLERAARVLIDTRNDERFFRIAGKGFRVSAKADAQLEYLDIPDCLN